MQFDADALLAALPYRPVEKVALKSVRIRQIASPVLSALGQPGEYNGFSALERSRTARLSNKLAELGATSRPPSCDICGSSAEDEHAENYYDLSRWIGLCRRCHRSLLHNRFKRPERWAALLDQHEIGIDHWSRLLAPAPFDVASLLRSRGFREPTLMDYEQAN